MKEEELKTLSKLRIKTAKDFLKEAKLNFKFRAYRTSINRAYYAVFYILRALLILEGSMPTTHRGTKTLFYLRFVQTKKFPQEMQNMIEELFKKRLDADYDEFISISKKEANKLLNFAEKIIKNIERFIIKNYNLNNGKEEKR